MKDTITVIIHTYNSEKDIDECIESAILLTGEIIVIDMESSDKTVAKAKEKGATVYSFPKRDYVEPSRMFGIEKAKMEWVFILDADERITPELAEEVRKSIQSTHFTHYKIPRKNIFNKTNWLRHGGWYPDHQIRLIKKESFVSWSEEIHSTPEIKGQIGYLKSNLIHYFHTDLSNMVKKTAIFESIEAAMLFKADRRVATATFFRKFMGELYRRLVKNAGFADGHYGIIESVYQAYSKTITYLFLYEKYLEKKKNTPL